MQRRGVINYEYNSYAGKTIKMNLKFLLAQFHGNQNVIIYMDRLTRTCIITIIIHVFLKFESKIKSNI